MQVQTVNGKISADELGHVLTHEHIFLNVLREYRGDGLLNDFDLAVDELRMFRDVGGRTIIDCTTRGLEPDPTAVARAAEKSGINIIMGCGFYRDPYLKPDWLDPKSAGELADELLVEVENGFGDTGVRPGIIGEIGADKWYISCLEERSFRAAARAQKESGLAITTHAARWPVGLAQLKVFEEEGVELDRVIVGHSDTVPSKDYHLELARRGAYVQFDTIRNEPRNLEERVGYVLNMLEHGFEDRVLLSHDVCLRSHLCSTGGGGYTLISNVFLPRLREAGVDDETIDLITCQNPRRVLIG